MTTTDTTTGYPCPARLLREGDWIIYAGRTFEVKAAHVLPGKVECGFFDVQTWLYSTEVLDPDQEVTLIRTASEGTP
jgi:hypothetical protein